MTPTIAYITAAESTTAQPSTAAYTTETPTTHTTLPTSTPPTTSATTTTALHTTESTTTATPIVMSCDHVICQNGGSCRDKVTPGGGVRYHCDCKLHFTGNLCQDGM